MKENEVLKITNLTFGYDRQKTIYDGFDLTLCRGKVVSIVGQSGSGKSTLFELITKNLKAFDGKIETKKLSSIYQDPYSSFHPSFSIKEQIDDVTRKDYEISQLEDIMQKLHLDSTLLSKKAHQLSGGQLQRCSILRAILMKPDIILADEPTSALDNVVALDTMKMLIEFLDRVGILLITHDKNLALWCSDEIINIEKKD